MKELLDNYLVELLHINDVNKNSLLKIEATPKKTIELTSDFGSLHRHLLSIVKERIGKTANTLLKNSSSDGSTGQLIGKDLNIFDWNFLDGTKEAKTLYKYMDDVYENLALKGNNVLFLSLGVLNWKVIYDGELMKISSPILIFPIKLVRNGQTSPVYIEFIDDDINFNPCLYAKLKENVSSDVIAELPHPMGFVDFDTPIELDKITDDYLDALVKFAESNRQSEDTVFDVNLDKVYISTYNHDEICMYYDLKRNKEKLLNHEIVNKMYLNEDGLISFDEAKNESVSFILPYDSIQEKIIREVVNTKSLIIKGPPGSGKTLTIANMIAALLAKGKKVLFSSKKESAMTEVFSKLPKEIRDFCLLLDAETEASAVKTSATVIKKELKRVIQERENYRNHNNMKDINLLLANNSKEIEKLSNYYDFVFNKDLRDDSYFDIINKYFEYEDLEEVDVIETDNALGYNKEIYNYLIGEITETQNIFTNLTKDNKYPLNQNPYYFLKDNVDTEKLYSRFVELKNKFASLIDLLSSNIENLDSITLSSLIWFLGEKLTDEDLKLLNESQKLKENKELLLDRLVKYLVIKEKDELNKNLKIDLYTLLDYSKKLNNLKLNPELNNKDMDLIYANLAMFDDDKHFLKEEKDVKEVVEAFKKIHELNEQSEKLVFDSKATFKKDLTKEDVDFIIESVETLQPFANENKKPGAFAFKAKKALDRLTALSFVSNPTLKELFNSATKLKEARGKEAEINVIIRKVEVILHQNLDDNKIKVLNALFKYVSLDVMNFVFEIKNNYNFLTKLAKELELANYEIKDLVNNVNNLIAVRELDEIADEIKVEVNLNMDLSSEIIAKNGLGLLYLNLDIAKALEAINFIRANKTKILTLVRDIGDIRDEMKDNFDQNHYLFRGFELSFGDIKIFNDLVSNKNSIGDFYKLKEKIENEQLNGICHYSKFVKRYNNNLDYVVKGKNEILNIFKHSFYNQLLKGKIATADNPAAITFDISNSAKKVNDLCNKLQEEAVFSIQDKLMSFIDPKDPAYLALNNEKGTKNLRLLFKDEKNILLKMKRCIILSPSTASALMRPEEYANFDVVIIDEASQMLPTEMLPLLFRARQAVIVGDENQMPPISHFKIKGTDEYKTDDEDYILNKEDSALALALKSKSFETRELKCHYRSRTESLIKFSQERFYDYMQTFPAALPRTNELGIEDIYIEDGTSVGAQNEKEAKVVIEKLEEHFEKFYDKDSGMLTSSVGVVAFGEKQLALILALVRKNQNLYNLIAKLEAKLGAVKEKTIFFKTIEKVQGQEADKLILSLTYAGGTQSMGELNRSYGECIFNVAVTRAKNKIIVIHSIAPEDITNENLSFIRQYLLITRELSAGGRAQFLSEEPTPLLESIGKYLESLGIYKERIVYGYGVTKGSIRIPIAVLSTDLQKAIFGLWVERDVKPDRYVDINSKYYNVLLGNGWNFYNVLAHDWYYNNAGEKENLANYIKKIEGR